MYELFMNLTVVSCGMFAVIGIVYWWYRIHNWYFIKKTVFNTYSIVFDRCYRWHIS